MFSEDFSAHPYRQSLKNLGVAKPQIEIINLLKNESPNIIPNIFFKVSENTTCSKKVMALTGENLPYSKWYMWLYSWNIQVCKYSFNILQCINILKSKTKITPVFILFHNCFNLSNILWLMVHIADEIRKIFLLSQLVLAYILCTDGKIPRGNPISTASTLRLVHQLL